MGKGQRRKSKRSQKLSEHWQLGDGPYQDWLKKARSLFNSDSFLEAIDAYDQAIKLRSRNAEAWIGKAKAWEAMSEFHDALFCWNQAILIDPKNLSCYEKKADLLEAINRLDDAIQCYKEAQKVLPNAADAYFFLGRMLERNHRFDEALKAVDRAIELNPQDIVYFAARANILRNLGQFEAAMEVVNRAYEVRPTVELHLVKCFILEDLGRNEEALALHDEGCEQFISESLMVERSRFRIRIGIGTSLDRFMAMDMDEIMAVIRGDDAEDTDDDEDYDDEEDDEDDYEEDDEDDYDEDDEDDEDGEDGEYSTLDMVLEAEYLIEQDQFEEALELYQAVAELEPGNPEMLMGTAICLAQLGDYDAALCSLEQSVYLDERKKEQARLDPLLESLHAFPSFRELVEFDEKEFEPLRSLSKLR